MKIKLPKLPKIKFRINKSEIRSFTKTLFAKRHLQSLVIIALILLNIFSQNYFVRIDATDSGNFSLSPATKKIITGMSDEITLEVYFSENIPPNLSETKQLVLDLYEEYAKSSDGKVTLDVKNPQSSDFDSSAQVKGLTEIQFSEYSQDRFEVARGYFGAAIVKDSETEVIPVLSGISNLEYDTTSKILKLTQEQTTKIGFLTGHEEDSLLVDLEKINSLLQTQFVTETVDFSNGKPLDPNDIQVLVIVGTKKPLTERDQFELDQYILSGGKVLILEDLFQLEVPILSKTEGNINDFLKNYGIEIESKILLDTSFTPIIAGVNQITYPYWVMLTEEGINRDVTPLNQLQTATFLWASPLKKTDKEGITHTELFTTTEFAWEETGESLNIDFKEFIPTEQKKYPIGYLVEGTVESAFKGKDIPILGDTGITDLRTAEHKRVDSSQNVKLAVIGDSSFVTNDYMYANEQNPVLFMNLVEWMANNDELTSIRSKNVTTRPLSALDDNEKTIYKVVNSALAPISTVILGVLYIKRRKTRPSSI